MPTFSYFDYVEVYDYDEAEDEFSLNFRDEFMDFKPEIWGKSNNVTYPEFNSTTYVEENIDFEYSHNG